jgi:hypothetical protein
MFKIWTCNLHNFQHLQSNATPQVWSEDGTWSGLAWVAAIWAGPFFQRVKGHSVFHAALSCASSGFEISNSGHRHQHTAISLVVARKWKITCGLRVFACGVSFSHPKWVAFTCFFWGPNGDSHRDAVSVNGRNTCSNFSLEPSRMILLNCARWCTCPWWLLCTIGLGFGFQGEISWRYIKCSQICPWQPSLLHELFPNFTPLTEIEDTARNNVNKNKKVYIKCWKNKGKFANATVTRCTTLGVATRARLHHWSVSTLSFTVAVGWRDL